MKHTIALASLLVIWSAPVVAQQTTHPVSPQNPEALKAQPAPRTQTLVGTYLREMDENEPVLGPGRLTIRQMKDTQIITVRGRSLGEVGEVVANNRGRIVGITADVGGFLGIGTREVLIPVEHLRFENGRYRLVLTEEQVKALPRWVED